MKHAGVLSLYALSCASAPRVDHPTPELTVPEQWTSASPDGAVGDHWWRDLGAAPLDTLIDQALAHNYDLKAAAARLASARAPARAAAAPLWPGRRAPGSPPPRPGRLPEPADPTALDSESSHLS